MLPGVGVSFKKQDPYRVKTQIGDEVVQSVFLCVALYNNSTGVEILNLLTVRVTGCLIKS